MKLMGIVLVALGGTQLAWAFNVLDASLHMGSPLRIQGPHIARKAGELEDSVKGLVELGSLGFSLLSNTIWVMIASGVVLMALGFYLLFSKRAGLVVRDNNESH